MLSTRRHYEGGITYTVINIHVVLHEYARTPSNHDSVCDLNVVKRGHSYKVSRRRTVHDKIQTTIEAYYFYFMGCSIKEMWLCIELCSPVQITCVTKDMNVFNIKDNELCSKK